ncbi:MAG TPA: hypothetical protein VNR18_14345 [Hyphomicrobiales bacterium]|nr:hypothetical protein [Hyphomicrobiales bacterium]
MTSSSHPPRTLVIQSASPRQLRGWMHRCLESVHGWSQAQGYGYRFVGDELFDCVPAWYRDKVGARLPIAADYARLVLLRQALEEGYEQAMWLDADVLVFDPSLRIAFEGSCAFGQEVWVQAVDGTYATRRNVHNAFCAFRRGCVVLPFLLQTTESLIRRVDPAHMAPQMVGPKLLTALHSLCDFALVPEVGALSPEVVANICAGGGPALDLLRRKSQVKPKAVNLCASLVSDPAALKVCEVLLASTAKAAKQ